jgi:CheY-like chemotaxis protein
LAETEGLADLTTILILPLGVSTDEERIQDAGFAGTVSKPVKPSSLLDALVTALAAKAHESLGVGPDEAPAPVRSQVASDPVLSPDGPRILLVEDNAVNCMLAKAVLKKFGHAADVAEDGAIAIEKLKESHYDLVLMDCQMPVLDGYAATRLIREPATGVLDPRIPIVAMTANAMQGDREKCLAAGMDDYLAKPLRQDELQAKLEYWLAPRSEQPEAL